LFAAPVIAWLIVKGELRAAVAWVILAALTDFLDGYSARKLHITGRFGVVLDPIADKILLVTLFFALTAVGLIPIWLFWLVMVRDLVIVGGSLLLRRFRGIQQFSPSMLGKESTFFQIVFVLLVLAYQLLPTEFLLWLRIMALWVTALFTTLSGLDYVRLGIRLTARQPLSPPPSDRR
jgi:cardiolipin synthase